ncbi:hypothetical protein CLV30_10698 [Haloactinopolyspora alba]|uniref:Uncharacterized protein n=1 Tax=Haloactinopolyspora alba TaxID=648780 RepID=A0A2P8E3P1_9ACTN|nr:hypothetical protein CLV30_10698 [Haloactinopolyspora alba]
MSERIEQAVKLLSTCTCREGRNRYGPWRQIDMSCPLCGDSRGRVQALVDAGLIATQVELEHYDLWGNRTRTPDYATCRTIYRYVTPWREVGAHEPTLPANRTEAGWPRCATCEGGGCHDCTDPAG